MGEGDRRKTTECDVTASSSTLDSKREGCVGESLLVHGRENGVVVHSLGVGLGVGTRERRGQRLVCETNETGRSSIAVPIGLEGSY